MAANNSSHVRTLAGCALGLPGALALSGVLRDLLFEVRPADP